MDVCSIAFLFADLFRKTFDFHGFLMVLEKYRLEELSLLWYTFKSIYRE